MANQDFFHEIAKTKHPIGSTDREVLPLEVSRHEFRRTGALALPRMEELSYEEQKKKFARELDALRAKYRPFMSNHFKGPETRAEEVKLREFLFRYMDKGEVFTKRNDPAKEWEKVTIPDYRGPVGKWNAYYKTEFTCPADWKERREAGYRVVLDFQCVDYIAEIYVNGNFAGRHEGLFAPFSFDVTAMLEEVNELVIVCRNDMSILGEGEFLDGDKIYAATGPGWNDSQTGWHHCPAGAGVFGKVLLSLRPEQYIDDIFVRPDPEHDMAEIRVGIYNYTDEVHKDFKLSLKLAPRNYEGGTIGEGDHSITAIGPGKNEYRFFVPVHDYRMWDNVNPWLYMAGAELKKDGKSVSGRSQTFGFKTFISDETSTPKGRLYMNGRPVILRGANEMGHLQQCVMQGDFDQLVDDILIAKLCNMNYYRVTQRPVQEEIYDYFDMLGMMHQCDLPLFGFLRRPQFCEAVRQVTEMEHLVRRHVSTALITFINEPMCIRRTEDPNGKFTRRYEAKGHRNLLRDELEAFFAAARKAVYVENPDRVIKNVEGDYDGPTAEGMPDFHTYTMWYTNHGQPIGKLMRGYLPPVKAGWMMGCGEYGAEGLDSEEVMEEFYPEEWLACEEDGSWYPDKIVRSQTHSVQGDWYKEQKSRGEWVKQSQLHQAKATRLMTEAFRRRADVINHTAIHLLIDAWPSGWMKTLLDCKRIPKRAYFAYQNALTPLRLNLYTGRSEVYRDETIPVECWALNDTGYDEKVILQAVVTGEDSETPIASFEEKACVLAASSVCVGIIPVTFPEGMKNGCVTVMAVMRNEKGEILYQEKLSLQVSERRTVNEKVFALGKEAKEMAAAYGLTGDASCETYLISDCGVEEKKALEAHLGKGGKALWLLPEEKYETELFGRSIRTKGCGELFFAAADGKWESYPVGMLYNKEKGYIDATASYTIETEFAGENLFYTYSKNGFLGSKGAKAHLPFVKRVKAGNGTLILSTLSRNGRLTVNPGLDRLFKDLLEMDVK